MLLGSQNPCSSHCCGGFLSHIFSVLQMESKTRVRQAPHHSALFQLTTCPLCN
ncbi:hypothetical protein LEMLEM_LOCUS7876 [Lemmus lemmus]